MTHSPRPPRRLGRRVLATLLLAAFLPLGANGCFGSFALTRKVYDANRDVSPDRWIRWLFFLAMNVVPVYAFAMGVDAFFANPYEFWSRGDNPVVSGGERDGTRSVRAADGSLVRATWLSGERLRLTTIGRDGSERVVVLSRLPDGAEARSGEGRLLGRVVDDGETLRFVRAR